MKKTNYNFKKNRKSGFTLIELMTVISIISLLSTVVLTSVNKARETAKMSSIIQFEAAMLRTIGDQMVGEWKFDEASGATVIDTSSFKNDGTVSGAYTRSAGIKGGALGLTVGVSTVNIPNSPSLALKKNSFTASIWTKTDNWHDQKVFRIGPNAELNYYQGYLRNCFNNCDTRTVRVNDNKWHHVAVIGDTTSVRLYFDGKLQEAHILPPSSESMAGGITIGNATRYGGLVDDFRVYQVPLNIAQVEQLYAEGLKTHQDLAINN